MNSEIRITDAEEMNREFCRGRGWTRIEDMTALWQAGSDEEYQAAMAIGDANAK